MNRLLRKASGRARSSASLPRNVSWSSTATASSCSPSSTRPSSRPSRRAPPGAGRERARSLTDGDGRFLAASPEGRPRRDGPGGAAREGRAALLGRARPEEVAVEFRAQIEAVLAAGLVTTHLEFRFLVDGGRADLLDVTKALAAEYGLAVRVWLAEGCGKARTRQGTSPARRERGKARARQGTSAARHERRRARARQGTSAGGRERGKARARVGASAARRERGGGPVVDHPFLDSFSLPVEGREERCAEFLAGLPPGPSEWPCTRGAGTPPRGPWTEGRGCGPGTSPSSPRRARRRWRASTGCGSSSTGGRDVWRRVTSYA
ncbi:ChbG/HpnK family deacetylase [Streptomyces sp. P6-2-1]|uniref:ChbG/HpnK family deacetylase n=1 Tax=Streptomyces sp. P6-2-1 TaxID=3422591 RepID=UPI003D364263